jgi:hypothetical protein
MPRDSETYQASLREKGDTPSSLEEHLCWLRDAGFAVGVPNAEAHYAVIAARRE